MGETQSAMDFMQKAIAFNGSDPEIFYNLGYILEEAGELDEAEKAYRKATTLRPEYAEAQFNLGNLLRKKGAIDEALESYKKSIEAKADFTEAYINLGNLLEKQDRITEAYRVYQSALVLCPEKAPIHYHLGRVQEVQGEKEDALRSYQKAIQLRLDFWEPYLSIAKILREQNKIDDSIAYLEKAVRINPTSAEILNEMGISIARKGDNKGAESYLNKAIQIAPSYVEARINMGNLLREQGRTDEAIQLYKKSLELCPASIDALNNLGIAFEEKGQIDEAINLYRQAILLNPRFYTAYYNLGRALKARGDIDSAIKNLREAIKLNDGFAPAYNELGVILTEKGNLEEAMAAYHKAIESDNTFHFAYHNLGNLFQAKGNLDQAISCYKKAIELCPNFGSSILHLAVALMNKDDVEGAVLFYHKALQIQKDYAGGAYAPYGLHIHIKAGEWELVEEDLKRLLEHRFTISEMEHLRKSLFNLCATDIDSKLIREKYEEYGKLMEQRYEKIASHFDLAHYDKKRLRIGYISPDLREHTMGYFTRSIMEQHDPRGFEIYCYSMSSHEDHITKEIKKLSSKFQKISDLPKKEAAHLIYNDKINILVDLAGHTVGNALEILAMKPAPLIVNHIGHANGTGLSTVDYKLTDYYADREDAASDYVEKLIRIPGCIYPHVDIPVPKNWIRREDYNIPEGTITFAAFCGIHKLNPRLLPLWRDILDRVKNAILLFSPPKIYRKTYLKLASSYGIDPECIRFLDTGGNFSTDQCRYNAVDIVLDTFPYGGGLTSINALNMLVPVVTLRGRKHGERMTYSILSNLGVTQTIAHKENEYISIACQLAKDSEFRGNVKEAIRKGLRNSPLIDMEKHVRYLETAYRKIWQRFVNGEVPTEINI
jgi:predicted O-linked N-acetylglucosamine transferase (SPINDLY family)